jgi:two-component system phosphate regulon sensor histidine kinase PhoR
MTQELDRPLKVAQLLLERLLTDISGSGYPETVAKTLKKSFAEVTKAVSILTRFCDFAQLSPTTEAKPIDLCQLANKIIAVCADNAQRVNLELLTKGLDVVTDVPMAERELEYIFFVLVQNAIEAADPNKTEQLTISCEVSNKQIQLIFADTCRGIPTDQFKDVLQPFLRAQPDGKKTEFGLATVKHIVGMHGGSTFVKSKLGEGTTFYLTLPID